MPIFSPGDIVRVPFPYVETAFREMRPALVITQAVLGPNADLFWALMITSAANRGWPGDVSLEDNYAAYGLPAPSVIRTEKVAVLESASANLLGAVGDALLAQVRARLAHYIGVG